MGLYQVVAFATFFPIRPDIPTLRQGDEAPRQGQQEISVFHLTLLIIDVPENLRHCLFLILQRLNPVEAQRDAIAVAIMVESIKKGRISKWKSCLFTFVLQTVEYQQPPIPHPPLF